MNNTAQNAASVTAQIVPNAKRLDALPRHFGNRMMIVERMVFGYMQKLSSSYEGGYWEFYDLSNGGFYMAPVGGDFRVVVSGNYFDGTMSADAAGIVACLFAYCYLANSTGSAALAEHYHRLRDYALDHDEASLIMAAID